jgi:hypothetical protein
LDILLQCHHPKTSYSCQLSVFYQVASLPEASLNRGKDLIKVLNSSKVSQFLPVIYCVQLFNVGDRSSLNGDTISSSSPSRPELLASSSANAPPVSTEFVLSLQPSQTGAPQPLPSGSSGATTDMHYYSYLLHAAHQRQQQEQQQLKQQKQQQQQKDEQERHKLMLAVLGLVCKPCCTLSLSVSLSRSVSHAALSHWLLCRGLACASSTIVVLVLFRLSRRRCLLASCPAVVCVVILITVRGGVCSLLYCPFSSRLRVCFDGLVNSFWWACILIYVYFILFIVILCIGL